MKRTVAGDQLDGVGRSRATRALPDLTPWLLLLWQSRREATSAEWIGAVDDVHAGTRTSLALRAPDDRHCLLADTAVTVVPSAVARLAYRLLGPAGTGVRTKLGPDLAVALLTAAVEQDDEALANLALELHVAAPRLSAIAPFVAMPMLLACARAWSAAIPADWAHGHCPVCAAWPALAERRGPDRDRCLRCSRCGAEWGRRAAHCPFCETDDPEPLALLATSAADRRVEACGQCRAYLKTLRTTAPIPPADVAVRDLLTLDLDLAALDAGLSRPAVRTPRLATTPTNSHDTQVAAPLAGG